MTVTVKHAKTNAISDWTQAQLDEQIALGNFAPGTTLAQIVLPSDWNNDHTLTGVGTMAEQNANSVAITGGTINNTSIGATTASTGKFTSVTTPSVTATTDNLTLSAISTGAVKFNTANGTQFQVTDTYGGGTSTNWIQASGRASNAPVIQAQGADTNITLAILSKGTGSISFNTNNGAQEQARVSHTASAVNYVQVTGAATGANPSLSAQGSDASVNLQIAAKGGGTVSLSTNGVGSAGQFVVSHTSSAVNYYTATGSAAGFSPRLFAQGNDTNIPLALITKGTGAIDLAAGSSGVNISNGGTVTAITRTALGTSYTSPPTVNISAPTTAGGVQATATVPLQQISPMTIVSGGTGYTVGDTLTVSGGTWSVTPTMTVATVSAGVITSITQVNYGVGTVIPSNPISVTGGTGTGATFSTTAWGIGATFTITNAGSGYIEQPTVTFSGGGGSGASAYATVGGTTIVRGLGTNIDFYVPSSISSASPALRIADGGSSTIYPQINNFGSTVNILAAGATNTQLLLGSNGTNHVTLSTNGTSRVEQLRVSHTASAVNFVQVTGAVTSGSPTISAQGSDANIPLNIRSKGVFNINFQNGNNNNGLVVDMTSGGTLANYVAIAGKVTGSAPTISALGTDTNIDLSLTTKGTGAVRFNTGGGLQAQVTDVASADSYVNLSGGVGIATVAANSASGNVDLRLDSRASGNIRLRTAGGTEQARVSHTASAVNYVQVTGAATTNQPTISAQGSDTNVSLSLASKGTGLINLQQATNLGRSSTNWLQVAGNGTGLAPSITSVGGDTNIDLTLTPKGTGVVQFGTHTANADTAISGYITIRDAGGTLRKLAVIT